jgi:hypothetical protein
MDVAMRAKTIVKRTVWKLGLITVCVGGAFGVKAIIHFT